MDKYTRKFLVKSNHWQRQTCAHSYPRMFRVRLFRLIFFEYPRAPLAVYVGTTPYKAWMGQTMWNTPVNFHEKVRATYVVVEMAMLKSVCCGTIKYCLALHIPFADDMSG